MTYYDLNTARVPSIKELLTLARDTTATPISAMVAKILINGRSRLVEEAACLTDTELESAYAAVWVAMGRVIRNTPLNEWRAILAAEYHTRREPTICPLHGRDCEAWA